MTRRVDSERRRELWREVRRMGKKSARARRKLQVRIARLETRQETLTRLIWALIALVLAGYGIDLGGLL